MLQFLLLTVILTTNKVWFSGQHLYYDAVNEVVYLTDSAIVRTEKVFLLADSVVYIKNEDKIFAYGSAVLIVEEDTLRADSLFYHTGAGVGVAYNGKTHLEKGWLTGKSIYRVSKNVLLVENGTFTTCELEPPHYHFYSPKMKIYRNDQAVVSPIFLIIGNIPVLWAPFWFFPTKKGRKSGFLVPRVGYNSMDGKYLRNIAYYLVLSNYADITVGIDLIEKRGFRGFTEFVYRRYRSFSGSFTFTLAQEFAPIRRRWSLFGSHFQTLPWGFTLRAQSNLLSDVSYMEDYSEEKEQWIKTSLHSFLSLSRRWKNGTFCLSADEKRDIHKNTIERNLPKASFRLFTMELGPLRFSASSDFLRRESEETRYYLDNRAKLTADLSLFYLKIRPSLDLISTLFDRDTAGNQNVLRNIYSLNVSTSTTIYGLSLFGIGPIKRFRSTITPSITFSYTPPVNQSNIEPFGGIGVINPKKSGTFSLTTVIEGKTKEGTKLSLLTASIATNYDLLRESDRITSISFNSKLMPKFPLNCRLSGSYNIKYGRLDLIELVTQAEFKLHGEVQDTSEATKALWKLRFTHTVSKSWNGDVNSRLKGSISGRPTKKWEMNFSFNYDIGRSKLIDERIELTRDLHCWAFMFRWSKYGEFWNYDFKLWIKKLPDIKFKKSLLEIFLPG